MAKRKASKDGNTAPKSDDQLLLEEAKKRFDMAYEADRDNRQRYDEDTRFATTNDQWPEEVKLARGQLRPALTFNKLPAICKQIIGDFRQANIGIKVRPADDKADPKIAEIYDGLIRNIQDQSKSKIAYNIAFECQVRGGFGAFRINTEYSDDDAFDQDLRIRPIPNPLSVYFDPEAIMPTREDARYCFVSAMMSRQDFEEIYPGIMADDFEDKGELGNDHWFAKDSVRIAEYWVKKPYTKRIAMLSDDTVVDISGKNDEQLLQLLATDPNNPITVVKEREVDCEQVHFYRLCGNKVLDEAVWPGKYIPIVPVYGEEVVIEGKRYIYSAIHYAKDAQRMYNYWKTTATEAVALAPKAPYLVTPEMIQEFEGQWQSANTNNHPFLYYNATPAGIPQRAAPAVPPSAEIGMALGAADDIKACTGIYDASLGAQGNETSGKAIMARQRQGDAATYLFTDNMAIAIEYAGKILVDLIPRIYDTERVVRILGADDASEMVAINKVVVDPTTGQEHILNDLSQGKYDVTVSTGLSYATLREEAVDNMIQFAQANKQVAPLIMDLIAKNSDWPGAEEIAERLKKMLPPGVIQADNDDPQAQQQAQMQQQQAAQQQQAQQMQAQMQMQQQQQSHELQMAKVQAENNKTMVENRKLDIETAKLHLQAQALQSGAMRPAPYLPQQ